MEKVMAMNKPKKDYMSMKEDPLIVAGRAAKKKAAIKKAAAEGPKKRTPVKKAAKKK
jgi:hypothetical protein